jgi:hypothetical protein
MERTDVTAALRLPSCMEPRMSIRVFRTIPLLALVPAAALASEGSRAPVNFTGPLVTPAVNTLPVGVLNIEPYLVYTNVRGTYGNGGTRHTLRHHSRQWQMALPVIYGLGETTAIQLTLAAARISTHRAHSDGLRMGDAAVRLQQRLTGPGEDGTDWVSSIAVAQRLPTGAYHHLGANPLNGMGNGSARTTLSYGLQKLQWLPDGQAVRWRGQLAWSPNPRSIRIHDTSVYGTEHGFRGEVRHGQAWNASLATEYALDSRWVLVNELVFNRSGTLRMKDAARPAWKHGPSHDLSLAPAVEYHFNANLGLIAGVQFSVAGRNTPSYVAPQAALNMVL